ncbi:MAG: type II toxin-antitoxin system VapC family toxin [Acidobacteria bacterium]|nr:type II toxin-antitoxin system VapC family toxin [Acidobacteriota bacterium]
MKVFIDSNIPMYVAGQEHPNRASALRFLAQVQTGELDACTSTEVLQEILYRYSAIGRRDLAGQVYDLFVGVCPVVLPITLADTDQALALLREIPQISARDAVHAAVMRNHSVECVATFDQDFDRVPGIRRLDLR